MEISNTVSIGYVTFFLNTFVLLDTFHIKAFAGRKAR